MTCLYPLCDKPTLIRGFCKRHYEAARKSGAITRLTPETRFWSSVDRRGADECWPWTAHRSTRGYGEMKWNKKPVRAHRVSWMLANGDIPEGMYVCHTCDNPPCCNPAHLFIGTAEDNVRDMWEKGRASNHPTVKTHCPQGHPYDGSNTTYSPDRNGVKRWRECKTCHAINERRARREGRRAS